MNFTPLNKSENNNNNNNNKMLKGLIAKPKTITIMLTLEDESGF
jgi:hypothetical protein